MFFIEFNVKLARSLYLCLNLILSVLYSYITVKFISVYNFPIYFILLITTLIEIFIFLDTSYFRILTSIKTKYFYYILIDIINRYLINNYMLYILNNIMYVGYFIMILMFLFNKNKKRKREEKS